MFALAVVAIYSLILLVSIAIAKRFEQTPHVFQASEKFYDLKGKTAIITGGNSGIGYYVAEQLAARGARTILACRDLHKAEAAKRRIIEATSNSNITIKRLNLASLRTVREFCAEVLASETHIDFLINNAGAIHLGDHETEDGLQITWQINYFAPFLLTNLLLDKLKYCNGKIVNVTGQFCANRVYLDDINTYSPIIWREKLSHVLVADMVAYFNAKSALYESSFEFARRLGTTGGSVCVFTVNPSSSNFYRRVYLGPIAILYFWLHVLFPKPEVEARKLVELILSDASITKYGHDDEYLANELWRRTCQLVNLQT